MPDEDNLKEWVEEKLDEGVDEERIKESLENTGHDPSIVDEVKSPFDDAGVDQDPFQEDQESKEDSSRSDSTDLDFTSQDSDTEESKERDDLRKRIGDRFSSLNRRIDLSERQYKAAAGLIGVFLVLGVGFTFLQSTGVLEPEKQCVGVKLYTLNVDSGTTTADVMTVEKARVVLEIFDNGERVGRSSKIIEGDGTISVNAVGDKASFHGIKCREMVSERNY